MRKLFFIFLLIKTSAFAQLNTDFSATVLQGCSPLTVQFKDLSTGGATSWFWDFGNGTTSYSPSPVVTYTDAGNYTVRLFISNSTEKNYEEKKNYITVFAKPDAGFLIADGATGCAPVQTIFTDTSKLFNASVKSWSWNFGDGNTSTQQNPAHSYTARGIYDVTLSIETTQGCQSTQTQIGAVKTGDKPTAGFSASPLDGCASTLRSFKNKSSGTAFRSSWYFGDGDSIVDRSPDHHYQDTGLFTVKLVVSDNGCNDSTEIKNYIHVTGPVSRFASTVDCSDKFSVAYRDRSIGENSRLWKFGDGSTSTDKSPVYTYASSGIYVATLEVTGNTCSDTASLELHINTSAPKINILPVKSFYCKYDSVQLFLSGFDTSITTAFAWKFGDGDTTSYKATGDTVFHVYPQNGAFNPIGFIRDDQRCRDSATLVQPLNIQGPVAAFTNPQNGCTNSSNNFKDESVSSGGAINQFLWSYGDGTTSTGNTPLNYAYTFPGTYTTNLSVTDVNGCFDTVSHTIEIFDSPTVNAGNDTLVCAGSSFTLNPTGAANYAWQTNAGLSCTNCKNPVATPAQSSTYYVTGAKDGCRATDSIHVKVQIKELVTVNSTAPVCEGGSVQLTASGADSYSWSPSGTLSNSTIANPVASPSANTVYTVTGKDNNNCFSDQAQVNVIVHSNPGVDIKDSVLNVIIGSTVTILATADNDAQSFAWTPASDLSCFNCLQPSATVSNTTTYTLTGTSSFGCSDSDRITINVLCSDQSIYVPNTFSPNNDGMNDYFFPRSEGNPAIKSFTIFNRWGQLIFQKKDIHANNFNDGWNGKYKGEFQQSDVYIYVMELQCSGNGTFLKKGNVSLIR